MHLIEVKGTCSLTSPESTLQEARERDSRIRTAVDQLYHLVDQVYRIRDWGSLGYTTCQGYVEKELGMTSNGPISS